MVVNEMRNNHVESSIDICPVFSLKSQARIAQLAMKKVLIQNVVKHNAGCC
jgi:hypothetical protein